MSDTAPPVRTLVLDTNIVLDLFIFNDPATAPLRAALQTQTLRCIATSVMRDELQRVLDYAHIAERMRFYQCTAQQVLAQWDAVVQCLPIAPKASAVCKDPDDQKFIDLAVAHQATLLSKDKAVLCMRKRLLALGVPLVAAKFL